MECRGCSGPKWADDVGKSYYCAECNRERNQERPCIRCGGERVDRGRSPLCARCIPEKVRLRTCAKCGSVGEKKSGNQYCPGCMKDEHEATVARRRARQAVKRKPCRYCKRPKGPGKGVTMCKRCRDEVRSVPCRRCKKPKPKRDGSMLCSDCGISKKIRNPCVRCEGPKEGGKGRLYCDKCLKDPARRAERAQDGRIYKHVRKERERGVSLDSIVGKPTATAAFKPMVGGRRPRGEVQLDAAPMREWLKVAELVAGGRGNLARDTDIEAKRYYEIAKGVVDTVRIGVADQAIWKFGAVEVPGYGRVECVEDLWPGTSRIARAA